MMMKKKMMMNNEGSSKDSLGLLTFIIFQLFLLPGWRMVSDRSCFSIALLVTNENDNSRGPGEETARMTRMKVMMPSHFISLHARFISSSFPDNVFSVAFAFLSFPFHIRFISFSSFFFNFPRVSFAFPFALRLRNAARSHNYSLLGGGGRGGGGQSGSRCGPRRVCPENGFP